MSRAWRLHAILVLAALVITLLHYFTPVSIPLWHHLYRRLYYLPVLGGAYWFSVRGGLGYALLVSIVYLPHALLHWHSLSDQFDQVAEMGMFFIIGGLVGWMLTVIRAHQATLRRQDRLALLGRVAAGVAHEVRNPLGGMKGAACLLAEMKLPPAAGEFLGIINREIERLERLVTDFVGFARPAPPRLAPVFLAEVVRSAIKLVATDAQKQQVRFQFEAAAGEHQLTGDAQQLAQVVLNLLLNAVKAMPNGGTVSVTLATGPDAIELAILDEGPGLAGADPRQLFEPFYTTRGDGTGLGLSIAREIVLAHGGELALTDRAPGPGAAARLLFPRSTDPAPTEKP